MALIGGVAENIVTKWILDPGNSKEQLNDLSKLLRQQAKEQKNLELVTKEYNKVLESTNKSMFSSSGFIKSLKNSVDGMSGSFVASVSAGNLLSGAMGAIVGLAKEGFAEVDKYSKAQRVFTGDLRGAQAALGGSATALEIMQTKNKMAALGIQLTDKEFNNLMASTKKMADAMGNDLSYALESVSTALSRKSTLVADNIGVVINETKAQEAYAAMLGKTKDQLTEVEKGMAFQNAFIAQITEKAKSLPPAIDTVTGSVKKLGVVTKDYFMFLGGVINEYVPKGIDPFGQWIINETNRINAMKKATDDAVKARQALWDSSGLISSSEAGAAGLVTPGFGKGGGGGLSTQAQLNLAESSARQRGAYQKNEAGEYVLKKQSSAAKGKKGSGEYLSPSQLSDFIASSFQNEGITTAEEARTLDEKSNLGAQNRLAYSEGIASMADEIDKMSKPLRNKIELQKLEAEATNFSIESHKRYKTIIKEASNEAKNMALSGLADMTGGIWAAADAAIQGGEGFGAAMAKMLKATLMSIAQQSTVKAVFETAEGFAALGMTLGVPNPASTAHFTAAGIFAGVAGVAGGAALALSAAGVGSGGSGSSETDRERRKAERSAESASFGEKKEKSDQPIIIHIEYDKGNPGTAYMLGQRVHASVKKAI